MSKDETLPGLYAASLVAIANSLINVDHDMANDYRCQAHIEAYVLGILAIGLDSDYPALLKPTRLDDAFYEGYDSALVGRQAEDACNNCDQKYGQCYSGCPWV